MMLRANMQPLRSPLLFLLASTAAAYLVPSPAGKYNVTLTNGPLVNYNGNDPYDATPRHRTLMLSIFQPTDCTSTVPAEYMPIKTATYQGPYLEHGFNISIDLAPLFLNAHLPVCPSHPDSCSPLDDVPILLFSTGAGVPRGFYNYLAASVSSQGFTVITIDHPDDTNIITYPNNSTVYTNQSFIDDLPLAETVRAMDASFIIDQLSNATAISSLLPHRGPHPFPTNRIAMFGHSLGGASAIVAASFDPRIRGAINWDGTIQQPLPPTGVVGPVLIIAHENFTDPSWVADWDLFHAAKLFVQINGSTHQSFSDVPTMLQAAGEEKEAKELEGLLGRIKPVEMVKVLTAYTTAWMEGVFEGMEGGALLEGDSGEFPEVVTVMKGNF